MSWGPSLHEGFQSCFQNERHVTFSYFARLPQIAIPKLKNSKTLHQHTGGRQRVFRFFHSHLALLVGSCPFEARESRYLNQNLYLTLIVSIVSYLLAE